jgi:hypothetical protein
MALLGSFVDSRTNAVLAAGGAGGSTTSFAHGLPAAPDLVVIYETSTSNTTSGDRLSWNSDATNVSITNNGKMATEELNVISIVFHSIAR